MNQETWKEIEETNGNYSISSLKRIRNNKLNKILKGQWSQYSLSVNGITTKYNINNLYNKYHNDKNYTDDNEIILEECNRYSLKEYGVFKRLKDGKIIDNDFIKIMKKGVPVYLRRDDLMKKYWNIGKNESWTILDNINGLEISESGLIRDITTHKYYKQQVNSGRIRIKGNVYKV